MAVEDVGINLQAKGFNDFIKKLDKIDKAQQEIFNVTAQKTGKTVDEVAKAHKKYEAELKRVDAEQKKAAKSAEKLAREEEKVAKAARKAAEEQEKAAEAAAKAAEEQKKARKAQVTRGAAAAGGAVLATGAAVIAPIAAVGAAVLDVANETDKATRQISASLGISAAEAANRYNDSLQQIFIDNPEAQFTDIANAIALTERALDLDTAGIETVASNALKLSQTFDQDVQKTIGATEQLIEQFGLSSQEATDLLTFGLQNIPVDDLVDSVGEYSNQFAQAGFSADEFFSVLSSGAAGGVLGTDKAADAVKEFQIRFLEGNKTLVDSFGTLGLNFDQLTAQVNSGQTDIADVFGTVVNRIGEVDLSIASNRAAVAGLGTQFEDLGAAAIGALDLDAIGINDVTGAANTLNANFANIGAAFESLKRSALVSLAPIGQTILELANNFVPKIKAAFDAARPGLEAFAAGAQPIITAFVQNLIPAFQVAQEALGRLGETFGLTSSNVDGASNAVNVLEKTLNGLTTIIQAGAIALHGISKAAETAKQAFAFVRAGVAAFGSIIGSVIDKATADISNLIAIVEDLVTLDFSGLSESVENFGNDFVGLDDILDKAGEDALKAFEDSIKSEPIEPLKVPVEIETPSGAGAGAGDVSTQDLTKSFNDQSKSVKLSDDALKSYQNTLKQAQDLQRSFARESEDNAKKLQRANEDIARSQAKQVADLEKTQTKDRSDLLADQTKQLDAFEKDRKQQIAKAESEIRQARKDAAEKQKRDQEKLQRELKQAQDRFNLSQLQSTRRFSLQESRLRAEGDILGLKELREDFALQQTEEKENFDQSRKEQISSASEQQKDQSKDLEKRLSTLKESLEGQRADLLASFDEQLKNQQLAHAEARAEQQRNFQEQAAERAIQLAREEEDRRISQARQLEDLGRSMADQTGVTAEGSAAIAGELENVFGVDGVADNIMTGFAEKTENEFTELFANIEKIVNDIELEPELPEPSTTTPSGGGGGGGFGSRRIGGLQEFNDGGIIGGPIGSPQTVIAHAGETVLPTHKSSFQMAAPVIPAQNLDVSMSGGFNISGGEQAGEAAVQAAVQEMSETFRIAVRRLARRN